MSLRRTHLAAAALTALGAALTLVAPAHADNIRQSGGLGIGLGSGTLSNGLSVKYFLNDSNALQFVAGTWGGGGIKDRFGNFGGLGVGGDYLYELPVLASASFVDIAWNLGAGVGVGLDDDALGLAGAFIAGLEFNFIPIPLSLVLEYRPTVGILPGIGVDLVDFTGHLRIHF